MIYVKNISETERSEDELRCKITIVTNITTMKGIIQYHTEDDVALVNWYGGKTK